MGKILVILLIMSVISQLNFMDHIEEKMHSICMATIPYDLNCVNFNFTW